MSIDDFLCNLFSSSCLRYLFLDEISLDELILGLNLLGDLILLLLLLLFIFKLRLKLI